MRAVYVPTSEGSPTLAELPTPDVTPGTVLVRVHAAGLNPVDNAIASGAMSGFLPHEYPLVLGRDAAGVVTAVGAGVEGVAPGDEVIGHILLAPPVRAGSLAEYVALPAATVVPKPSTVDFETAAAIPLAGAAAAGVIDAVDPQPGQTVLIVGATGGVGLFAVQLAAARGATVIATGLAADAARLRSIGASEVVDYTAGDIAEQVLALQPDGVDGLVDLVARTASALPLAAVRKGGTVATTLSTADEETLAAAGLTGTNVMATPVRDIVGPLVDQVAAGTLRVFVDEVLPLDGAIDGLATLRGGQTRGKIVVRVAPSTQE